MNSAATSRLIYELTTQAGHQVRVIDGLAKQIAQAQASVDAIRWRLT